MCRPYPSPQNHEYYWLRSCKYLHAMSARVCNGSGAMSTSSTISSSVRLGHKHHSLTSGLSGVLAGAPHHLSAIRSSTFWSSPIWRVGTGSGANLQPWGMAISAMSWLFDGYPLTLQPPEFLQFLMCAPACVNMFMLIHLYTHYYLALISYELHDITTSNRVSKSLTISGNM